MRKSRTRKGAIVNEARDELKQGVSGVRTCKLKKQKQKLTFAAKE
jgi:hypothetical protein